MATSAYNKFDSFSEELAKGTHNLSTHALKVVLTNTAPVATNTILANITQVGATGGYTAGGYTVTSSLTRTGGVTKLTISDRVITATGGSVGPFQYVVLYNDTPTSPVDPLMGWYNYGSSITLGDGESLTMDFDDSNGVLTIG